MSQGCSLPDILMGLWKHGWILWTLSFLRTWSSGDLSKNVNMTSDLAYWNIDNNECRFYNVSLWTLVEAYKRAIEQLSWLKAWAYLDSVQWVSGELTCHDCTFQGRLMAFFNSLSTSLSFTSMSFASLIFSNPEINETTQTPQHHVKLGEFSYIFTKLYWGYWNRKLDSSWLTKLKLLVKRVLFSKNKTTSLLGELQVNPICASTMTKSIHSDLCLRTRQINPQGRRAQRLDSHELEADPGKRLL